MKTLIKIILPVLLIITNYVIAQTTFERSYNFGGGCDQEGYQVSEIDTNQYLFLNWINCNMFGESVDLLKVNQVGDSLISSSFSYGHYTGANHFIQTGNSFVIPITSNTSGTDGSTTILKVDSALQEVWHKTYYVPGLVISCGTIIQTSDGGYIAGGSTNLNLNPYQDLLILKLDSNGDSLWSKIVSFNQSVTIYSILEGTNSSLIFMGSLYTTGHRSVFIYKTDSLGDSLNAKIFNDFGEGLFMSKWRNEFVVGGDFQDSTSATWNGFMLFLDSNLDSTSSYIYDTGGNEGIYSGTADSNEFIVTGTVFDSAFHSGKLFIMKFDSNNVFVSNKIFSQPDIYTAYSTISTTLDGGLIIGSTTRTSNGYYEAALLIKTDMAGEILSTTEIPMSIPDMIGPNPSTGKFYLNGKNAVRTSSVYSILGKKVCEFSGNEIDLSGYGEGIYFYEAEFFSGAIQKGKLIKIN